MRHIIIDDISILMEPRFLWVNDPDCRIYTSIELINSSIEIAGDIKSDRNIPPLIEEAIEKGTISIFERLIEGGVIKPIPDLEYSQLVTPFKRTLGTKGLLLEMALTIRMNFPSDEVHLSTVYEKVLGIAHSLDLWASSSHIYRPLLKKAKKHPELQGKVNDFILKRTVYKTVGLVSLIVLLGVAYYTLFHFNMVLAS